MWSLTRGLLCGAECADGSPTLSVSIRHHDLGYLVPSFLFWWGFIVWCLPMVIQGLMSPHLLTGGTAFQVWVGLGTHLSNSDGEANFTSSEVT